MKSLKISKFQLSRYTCNSILRIGKSPKIPKNVIANLLYENVLRLCTKFVRSYFGIFLQGFFEQQTVYLAVCVSNVCFSQQHLIITFFYLFLFDMRHNHALNLSNFALFTLFIQFQDNKLKRFLQCSRSKYDL